MKKADGWSMGQEEQKKKALEEKLRRRAYTAAFEAAQQRKEKPWQSWDEAFSERLAKQPFITEEERKPFAPSGAGAQNAFYTGEKQPWPGLGEAWPGQARRAGEPPRAALPENLPDGAGTMLLAGQRRSMAQAAPGGEPPAGPEQGAPGFALEGVDPAYRDAVYAGQALAELLRPERRKAGPETGKALQPGGGYGTLKKRQDTESWRDAFLEQQAALQAQTLAQERAQAEGVGAAYTKYVRPLLERAALGLSTALSPIPSVPGSEPGTGLAQAIETSNANYERNKTHDISGRPVHGQGVDAAGDVTTLGRGGSDTSAVALAAFLGAKRCIIYTDVDGVYTTDPRVCPTARRLAAVSCDQMLRLAANGAQVLHDRSVALAARHGVTVEVRSCEEGSVGTLVVPHVEESREVTGVTRSRCGEVTRVTTIGRALPSLAAIRAAVSALEAAGITVLGLEEGEQRVTLLVKRDDEDAALCAVHDALVPR